MKEALVNVAVLLVFFTRHEQFEKVFEQVKKARPSQLFLYQDGPRERNKDDIENIAKCRAIAENIDWNCEVHKYYQENNIGCDPSGYIAHTWAFSNVDKCIVLEDDVVPSVSFFSFCKEMLNKYENDERIMLICGMNYDEITKDLDTDYFFSSTTFTWGWASWSRVVNKWDKDYTVLNNEMECNAYKDIIQKMGYTKNFINVCKEHRNSGVEHFETILITNQHLNSGLSIVPSKNMINNIGVTNNSTHYTGSVDDIPKGLRKIFLMKRYEMDVENVIHPKYVIENVNYKNRAYRTLAWDHPYIKGYRFIVSSFIKLKHGEFKNLIKDTKEKMKKVKYKTNS